MNEISAYAVGVPDETTRVGSVMSIVLNTYECSPTSGCRHCSLPSASAIFIANSYAFSGSEAERL